MSLGWPPGDKDGVRDPLLSRASGKELWGPTWVQLLLTSCVSDEPLACLATLLPYLQNRIHVPYARVRMSHEVWKAPGTQKVPHPGFPRGASGPTFPSIGISHLGILCSPRHAGDLPDWESRNLARMSLSLGGTWTSRFPSLKLTGSSGK